ncbi:MAG: HAMP domain-containing histidine kinase [Planctomycetes bacterium]|nr:HAMP domain-containing histidine kinase [Planctomycetota bacterium]
MAKDVAHELLGELEWLVLELGPNGVWTRRSHAPKWLVEHRGEAGGPGGDEWPPFLATFLDEAREHFTRGVAAPLRSLMWCEVTPDGREWPLQASALDVGGRRLVFVEWLDERYAELRAILQRARQTTLEFDSLHREVLKKEVLLHCIVHDLKSPLAGIVGSLSLLADGEQDAARRELVAIALESARRQEVMIRQVLDVFASELSTSQSFARDPREAPDLVESVRSVLQAYGPVFQRRSVGLTSRSLAASRAPIRVVGRADRLERVLANLLENALRHSDAGDEVELEFVAAAQSVELTISDRGPGVPETIRATLFQKFVQSGPSRGVAGLGLFYCKNTLEQWGGAIGYEPREPKGSTFRVALNRALAG